MNVTEIGTKESRIHCDNNGCRQKNSAEHEGYDGVLTDKRITVDLRIILSKKIHFKLSLQK